MNIRNSSGVSVRGKSTFNSVHGNQVNHESHTTITAEVVHMHGDDAKVTERTIFGEFDYVKRGHVIGMKGLGSVVLSEYGWCWKRGKGIWRRHKSAQKTISTVGIYPDRQSKFTAITYEGENAQKAWEKDFKQFSRGSRTGLFQLFGINRSEIPMLIFYHELIPLAHFYTDSFWMNVYIHYLVENKRCLRQDLWLNTSNSVLCEGPIGPGFTVRAFNTHKSVLQALPSTFDMLEEGTSVAFFSKFGSNVDSGVLQCAWWFRKQTYLDDLFPKTTEDHRREDNDYHQLTTDHPYLECLWRNPPHYLPIDIIGELHFGTVYSPSLEPIARWPPEAPGLWKWRDVYGLIEMTRVDGGLTRFKLICQSGKVCLDAAFDWETFWEGWLSQSSRVFDFLKMTGHQENVSVVRLSWLELRHEYEACDGLPAFFDLCNAVEETRPIYLFLRPLPMTISQLISWMGGYTHFWSFDENGRSRIPKEEWERWGIPVLTPYTKFSTMLFSWPTHIYPALRKWQIARGFDPSTADWARECGYPEFEIVGAKKDARFEGISEQPGVPPIHYCSG